MRFNIGLKRGARVALDLGNSNTVITNNTQSLMSQPSFIVLNKGTKAIKAVGEEAYDIVGKSNDFINVVKPLKGGIITDFEAANKMLREMIKKVYPKRSFFNGFDQLVSGVPYSSNEVERRALRDALKQFRTRKTSLIFEPIAAAIGIGLNIEAPNGKFLIDIGGGITEIALISHSNIVAYHAIRVAGETFDENIQDHFAREHNVFISTKRAESIKVAIGAASKYLKNAPAPIQVVGTDLTTGNSKEITIDHVEIATVLDDALLEIENAIIQTLEESPPELAGDVFANGIHITGGSVLLRGLKERLEARLEVAIHQDVQPLCSVTNGISNVFQSPTLSQSVLFQ